MRGFKVELSDGSLYNEETIKSELFKYIREWELPADIRPWILLKEYTKRKSLKVFSLQLQFDHQGIFLPRHAKVYFYSMKVEAYLGGEAPQVLYYGVGASDRSPEEVEITWYDGNNSKIERRKVDEASQAFIIN